MNSYCLGEDEFNKDFNLANKIDSHYTKKPDELRRLINMVITFYNVFDREAATRILFYQTSHPVALKTILVVLNRFPESLEYLYQYELDFGLLKTLQQELK